MPRTRMSWMRHCRIYKSRLQEVKILKDYRPLHARQQGGSLPWPMCNVIQFTKFAYMSCSMPAISAPCLHDYGSAPV